MKYDVERFYFDCVQIVKDKIDDVVDALNAEKSDNITISKPTANQFKGEMTSELLNENFFILHSLGDTSEINQEGGDLALPVKMIFYAVFSDPEGDEDTLRKALRYTRALQTIFQENQEIGSQNVKIKITSHYPQSTQFENSTDWYKIGGIEIEGTILL